MHSQNSQLTLHVARPGRGSDLRYLVRELSRLAGVLHVAPLTRFSRILRITYDPHATAATTFIERARRHWGRAQLVRPAAAV